MCVCLQKKGIIVDNFVINLYVLLVNNVSDFFCYILRGLNIIHSIGIFVGLTFFFYFFFSKKILGGLLLA